MEEHMDQNNDVEMLQKRVEELESALELAKTDHRRALADYTNLQRVSREERQRVVASATADLISQLLEPMDYLQTAASHFQDKSLEMIRSQFMRILEQEGLKVVEAEGKPFDPHTMEAVEAVPGQKEKVLKVRQPGFMLGTTLLRPAKVEVGNGEE